MRPAEGRNRTSRTLSRGPQRSETAVPGRPGAVKVQFHHVLARGAVGSRITQVTGVPLVTSLSDTFHCCSGAGYHYPRLPLLTPPVCSGVRREGGQSAVAPLLGPRWLIVRGVCAVVSLCAVVPGCSLVRGPAPVTTAAGTAAALGLAPPGPAHRRTPGPAAPAGHIGNSRHIARSSAGLGSLCVIIPAIEAVALLSG